MFLKFEKRWCCLYFFHKDPFFFAKRPFFFAKPFFFFSDISHFSLPLFLASLPILKNFFASLCLCPLFESSIPLLKGVGEETICITGCYVEFFKHIYSIYSHFNPSTSDERNIKKKKKLKKTWKNSIKTNLFDQT